MDQSVKLVNPEDLPKGVNVRREFENKRWEMFARNLAVGMKRTQAYTLAGYNSKDALRDSARTLAAHPEITARAEFLERERFDKRMKQETGFLAHEFCVESSLELIASAKRGDPVLHRGEAVLDEHGEPLYKPDRMAWARGIHEVAAIEGLLIQRHRFDQDDDGIEQMGPDGVYERIKMIVEAAGGSYDRAAFDAQFGFTGPPIEALASRRALEDGEVVDVSPTPEAAGAPRQGSEVQAAPPDGGQPAWEVGVRIGGSGDARDGDLPGVVEGGEVRQPASDLVRRGDGADDPRRDPGEALRASRLGRNGVDSEVADRKYDPLPGRARGDRFRTGEAYEWDDDEDRLQEL